MGIYDGRSKEDIMTDQAVEIRELIPEVVKGICADSMACCPTEVFYFAKLYIEELQEENKKLRDRVESEDNLILSKFEQHKLKVINEIIWKAMDKLIEKDGYSDLTLHLEGSYYEIRDMIEGSNIDDKNKNS